MQGASATLALAAELDERRERVADRRGVLAAAELALRELQESALLGAEGRIGLLRGGLDQIRHDAKHGAAPDALAGIASCALDEDTAAAALAQEHPGKVADARSRFAWA